MARTTLTKISLVRPSFSLTEIPIDTKTNKNAKTRDQLLTTTFFIEKCLLHFKNFIGFFNFTFIMSYL